MTILYAKSYLFSFFYSTHLEPLLGCRLSSKPFLSLFFISLFVLVAILEYSFCTSDSVQVQVPKKTILILLSLLTSKQLNIAS
jgi:hypothetical protein